MKIAHSSDTAIPGQELIGISGPDICILIWMNKHPKMGNIHLDSYIASATNLWVPSWGVAVAMGAINRQCGLQRLIQAIQQRCKLEIDGRHAAGGDHRLNFLWCAPFNLQWGLHKAAHRVQHLIKIRIACVNKITLHHSFKTNAKHCHLESESSSVSILGSKHS